MPAPNKQWNAKSHLITFANCKKTIPQSDVVKFIESVIPKYKSLSIACEQHKDKQLHYHIFINWKTKFAFRRSHWADVMDKLGASVFNVKTWSKLTRVTKPEWIIEKWRYCNNLVNKSFKSSKGADKGSLWVYNKGKTYRDLPESSEDISPKKTRSKTLNPQGQVLKAYISGVSLRQQYIDADEDDNFKSYIAGKFEFLTKMIAHHDIMMRIPKPRFTKADFKLIPEAESHDFSSSCLVLQGGSDLGKTQYAKTFFKNPLMVGHMDKLKKFDPKFHDGIVFDDVSFGHFPRDPTIQIFTTEEESDINVKCSMITIPAGTPKIFCTNRELRKTSWIHDIAGHDKDNSFLPPLLVMAEGKVDTAIDRRFKLIKVESSLKK